MDRDEARRCVFRHRDERGMIGGLGMGRGIGRSMREGGSVAGLSAIGMDLSLNHGGIVLLRGFDIASATFVTQKRKPIEVAAKDDTIHGIHQGRDSKDSRELWDYKRLVWWGRVLRLLAKTYDDVESQVVGIEDYAFAAQSSSLYQYGELGGLARWIFRNRRFRFHDPISVKLYTAGKGNAKPAEVEEAVRKRWGQDFRRFNASTAEPRISDDLAVAYAIARMLIVEQALRRGTLRLDELEEGEIRVFNRATKRNPVNLLARGWIGVGEAVE